MPSASAFPLLDFKGCSLHGEAVGLQRPLIRWASLHYDWCAPGHIMRWYQRRRLGSQGIGLSLVLARARSDPELALGKAFAYGRWWQVWPSSRSGRIGVLRSTRVKQARSRRGPPPTELSARRAVEDQWRLMKGTFARSRWRLPWPWPRLGPVGFVRGPLGLQACH